MGGAGRSLGDGGGCQDFALAGGEGPGAADLADDAGLDAGSVHALGHVADYLLGKLVGGSLGDVGRVGVVDVEGGSHDYVDSGGAGYSRQSQRIAGYADACGVHERRAAELLVEVRLVYGSLNVQQARVFSVGRVVVADVAEYLRRLGR